MRDRGEVFVLLYFFIILLLGCLLTFGGIVLLAIVGLVSRMEEKIERRNEKKE
jgi:hypothetical protein